MFTRDEVVFIDERGWDAFGEVHGDLVTWNDSIPRADSLIACDCYGTSAQTCSVVLCCDYARASCKNWNLCYIVNIINGRLHTRNCYGSGKESAPLGDCSVKIYKFEFKSFGCDLVEIDSSCGKDHFLVRCNLRACDLVGRIQIPRDRAARVGVPHAAWVHFWRACHDYGQWDILIGEAFDALTYRVYSARCLLIDCSNIVQV